MIRGTLRARQFSTANTENSSKHQREAKARTINWQEIYEWQFNKYIHSGYRPMRADYLEIFTSLTYLHNEFCNVYTHLIGALLLPFFGTTYLRYLAAPQFVNVTFMDYAIFGSYLGCAEICLALSAFYHLMQSYSHQVERFWHGMDLLGIVIVTMGTLSSGIYYVFFCEANLQKLHWAIVWITATVTGISHLESLGQNATMAEIEGGHLGYFRCFIRYAPATWSSTIRAGVYAGLLWRDVVPART